MSKPKSRLVLLLAALTFFASVALGETYALLQEGNTGESVLALKTRMMELGYYGAGSKLTDRYDETTTERVRRLQKKTAWLPQESRRRKRRRPRFRGTRAA